MAARSGKPSPSHTPRDRTKSPSSQRISSACPDEAATARASETSCIPQTRLPQTLSAGVRRGLTEIAIVTNFFRLMRNLAQPYTRRLKDDHVLSRIRAGAKKSED